MSPGVQEPADPGPAAGVGSDPGAASHASRRLSRQQGKGDQTCGAAELGGGGGVRTPELPWGDEEEESVSRLVLEPFFLLSCLWSLMLAMMAAALRASASSGD